MLDLNNNEKKLVDNFIQYSKILEKNNDIDSKESKKFLFYQILKELAKIKKISLPFKISKYEKKFKSLKQFELNYTLILENLHLLDLLFEKIDVEHRKEFGQILTPIKVAEFMTSLGTSTKTTVLDPAVGTGIFPSTILENVKNTQNIKILGFDIDPLVLNATFVRIKIQFPQFKNLMLKNENFLEYSGTNSYDFVICNPPYLNFHDFDNQKFTNLIEKKFNMKISKLTNIYSLFFIASSKFLKPNGKMVFITPSEFFYTGYGETLKQFLLETFTINGFVIFDFTKILFEGHLTTAVITYLEKKKPSPSHKINFIKIKKWPKNNSDLKKILISDKSTDPNFIVHRIPQSEVDPSKKWLIYFESHNQKNIIDKLVPLSEIATVNRGIATGNNDYFTLSKSDLKKWNIEQKFIQPVLSRAQYSKDFIFTKENWNNLSDQNKKVHLLYCFEKPSKNLQKYIDLGENLDVHKRYLCAHRKPWYSMERRKIAPILASVFNRNEARFVYNQAKSLNLSAYHGIYPYFDDEITIKALLCYLNSGICAEIQTIARREYGGGLHKFEPRDLEKIPVLDVTKLKDTDLVTLAKLFEKLSMTDSPNSIKKEIDTTVKSIISKI